MNSWLVENLVCPRHHGALAFAEHSAVCPRGCSFPIVDGVPVMLLREVTQTMDLVQTSLRLAESPAPEDPLYVESLGLSDEEKAGIRRLAAQPAGAVDPVVSFLVGATNGMAYGALIGKLPAYPIPELRLPPSSGTVLLDLGCNWGRWCFAAARKSYFVVGIDPSLGAVMAARRTARALGVDAIFVVGDARYLPFKAATVGQVFSYSVLQHLSRQDVARVVKEIKRVLVRGGSTMIQMPTRFGIRCLYHQARRRFREGSGFEVRYWSLPALRRLFAEAIGPTRFSVDCFFGIGLQASDRHLMRWPLRVVISASEGLRWVSGWVHPLLWVADSVYVAAVSEETPLSAGFMASQRREETGQAERRSAHP